MILGDYKRKKADPMTQAYANSKQRRNNPDSTKYYTRKLDCHHPLAERLSDNYLRRVYMDYALRSIKNSHLLRQKPERW